VDQTSETDREEDSSSGGPEPAENFLALYFREMADLSVLKPEEEFEAARSIEDIEVRLWKHLLSYPQLQGLILDVVERGLEDSPSELTAFRRQARKLTRARSAARKVQQQRSEDLAKALHALDVDRKLLLLVLGELRRVARGARERFGPGRPPVNIRSKTFQSYFHKARAEFARSQRARNDFVKANLRLVVSIARRFNHGKMALSDLIQEGNIGLIKAVERYDYRRGYRFSTYASWWIRHAISRALADKGRAVRLPVHMLDAYHKVARTSRELSSRLGRPPTAKEISCASGIPPAKVEKIQGFLVEQSLSLDRAVSEEDDRRFVEMIQDPDALKPAEKILERSVSDQVVRIISDLKPIEADVLRKRFGLNGQEEQTLKEIGERYSLSRERIRQIQEQALGKIRRALARRSVI
jgi:RNA polymerase primary sigma factor